MWSVTASSDTDSVALAPDYLSYTDKGLISLLTLLDFLTISCLSLTIWKQTKKKVVFRVTDNWKLPKPIFFCKISSLLKSPGLESHMHSTILRKLQNHFVPAALYQREHNLFVIILVNLYKDILEKTPQAIWRT